MAFQRSDSRFSISDPIQTIKGDGTFGLMKKFQFMDRNNLDEVDIKKYTVPSDRRGRPDLIANDIYGNPDFHWIIIFFNRIESPFGWPTVGQIIEYPAPGSVLTEL